MKIEKSTANVDMYLEDCHGITVGARVDAPYGDVVLEFDVVSIDEVPDSTIEYEGKQYKGYTVVGENWSVKRQFECDADGNKEEAI